MFFARKDSIINNFKKFDNKTLKSCYQSIIKSKIKEKTIWLNKKMLSPYDYWQFWRNTDDRDVLRFLKMFTDLKIEKIEERDLDPMALLLVPLCLLGALQTLVLVSVGVAVDLQLAMALVWVAPVLVWVLVLGMVLVQAQE